MIMSLMSVLGMKTAVGECSSNDKIIYKMVVEIVW
jgi:hypothetical protein